MSIILNSPAGISPACIKRRKDSDDEDEFSSKRTRHAYYVTLESESPLPSSEDDESIYTVQGNETEYVQDTSDTSTHSWASSSDDDDVSVRLEFEVASHSEEENPMLHGASSSDPEDFVTMGVIAAIYNETDIGFADDSDDSRCTLDSEIGRADYWTCVQCRNTNNNPLFRYCEKCYQIRKNFFPPRPKRKKRPQIKEQEKSVESPKPASDLTSSQDSGIGSQDLKSTQDSDVSKNLLNLESSIEQMESGSMIGECNSENGVVISSANTECKSQDTDVGKNGLNIEITVEQVEKELINIGCNSKNEVTITSTNTESKNVVDTESDKMCIMCTVNTKNGAFSHGGILHVCCCYKCAVKIWRTSKLCPICNRKITNVQKVFYN